MQDEIAKRIIGSRNLSAADKEIIGAFAFAAAMRQRYMQVALDTEDITASTDALEQEQNYAREMRSWADKRRDLFGDEQLRTQGVELSPEEQKKKDTLTALRNRSAA